MHDYIQTVEDGFEVMGKACSFVGASICFVLFTILFFLISFPFALIGWIARKF